jgi:hypothetical protein
VFTPYYIRRPSRWVKRACDIDKRTAVSEKNEYIYIRIPKCANSTVVATLDHYVPIGEKSIYENRDIGDVKSKFDNMSDLSYYEAKHLLESGFIFTIVRNPYKRLLSAYLDKFRTDKYKDRYGHEISKYGNDQINFVAFCRWIKSEGLRKNAHWIPQTEYIENVGFGNVDYIGKVETLEKDIMRVLRKIGVKKDIKLREPHFYPKKKFTHSTNADKKVSSYYNQECIDIVRSVYSNDFQRLKYRRKYTWD